MMDNLSEDDRWVHGDTVARIEGVLGNGTARVGDARQTARELNDTLSFRGMGWLDDGEARSALHELSKFGQGDLRQVVSRMDRDRLQHLLYDDDGSQISAQDREMYRGVIARLEQMVPRRS